MSDSPTKLPKTYSTDEAAEYLKISIPTLKRHVHETKLLVPDLDGKKGHRFLQSTLDAFNEVRKELDGRKSDNKRNNITQDQGGE